MRSRNWCFTINNYSMEDINRLKALEYKYIVFGEEVGSKGTPHIQGYIEFKNARSFQSVSKKIKGHIEKRKGNAIQASQYCKKDGKFYEDGTCPIKQMCPKRRKRYLKILLNAYRAFEHHDVDDSSIIEAILYFSSGKIDLRKG